MQGSLAPDKEEPDVKGLRRGQCSLAVVHGRREQRVQRAKRAACSVQRATCRVQRAKRAGCPSLRGLVFTLGVLMGRTHRKTVDAQFTLNHSLRRPCRRRSTAFACVDATGAHYRLLLVPMSPTTTSPTTLWYYLSARAGTNATD